MPFIPHTGADTRRMLDAIGAASVETLFEEIPSGLRVQGLPGMPPPLGEMEMMKEMSRRAARDQVELSFLGAGAYRHHIPAAVWDLASRGEFMTAYTPYQAEASQGTLQLIYEYQSMITSLTAMDVANASVYDGAGALAEAVLMAVRANRKAKYREVVIAGTVHPLYRAAVEAIVRNQDIGIRTLDWNPATGLLEPAGLAALECCALVVSQPNFFGGLEAVDQLTDLAHGGGALVIAVVNPVSLALFKPPGEWGREGADIVVGDGQPLGVPLASGGPYFGFMCCRQALVRQLPGRIIGRTVDQNGRTGFTLTLQAREQHIRRAKATSNICTNQGLLVTAATIHLSLLGANGLRRVAQQCHANAVRLCELLCGIPGVSREFTGPFFHEFVLRFDRPLAGILEALLARGLIAGFPLGERYAGLPDRLLVNATEMTTADDMARFATELAQVMNGAAGRA